MISVIHDEESIKWNRTLCWDGTSLNSTDLCNYPAVPTEVGGRGEEQVSKGQRVSINYQEILSHGLVPNIQGIEQRVRRTTFVDFDVKDWNFNQTRSSNMEVQNFV